MSVKNYRFVSPGVFINEIDNSQIPASPAGIGPVIIGRSQKGPALRPTQVNSFSEFVQVFGNPSPGGDANDVWRQGASLQAPTYGAYAAQAYLRNSSPLTFIRLLGAETTDGTLSGEGVAGWKTDNAYGLVIFERDDTVAVPGTLASGSVTITGGGGAIPPGKIISLTNSVGLAVAYESAVAEDLANNKFANITSNAAIATSLFDCITNAAGHGSTITVVDNAVGGLSLTQSVTGTDGNTVFDSDAGDVVTTGFLGGLLASTGWEITGALAAIFYTNSTAKPELSGTVLKSTATGLETGDAITGSNILVERLNNNNTEFKMILNGAMDQAPVDLTTAFNFDINSSKYIRKVFNTNPQLMDTSITLAANRSNYFLGETFDRHLNAHVDSAKSTFAALVRLYRTTGTTAGSNFNVSLQSAQTPWIIGCDLGDQRTPNLIRFHALGEPGDWTSRSLKISIQDLRQSNSDSSDYGTFSVVVRRLSDSDNVVEVVEQYNDCDLNPNSLNYICRKIGDKYTSWSDTDRLYRERGDWDNNSSFLRVEVNSDIDAGILNAAYLPFGFKGIMKYNDEELDQASGSGNWVTSSAFGRASTGYTTGVLQVSGSQFTADVLYPSPEFRVNASDGNLSNTSDAYFGLQTTRTAGGTVYDPSTIDTLRPRGGIVGSMFGSPSVDEELSLRFTLDDVSGSAGVWISGSHTNSGGSAAGTSLTAVDGYVAGVLDAGFNRFTVPLFGGFDGLAIEQMDPFANYIMNSVTPISDQTSYQFNSIRRSIDSIADPEVVEMNLASMPGITHEGLTTNLVTLCEDRADSLAVIDLSNGYTPRAESTKAARNNLPSTISSIVTNMRARGLNSSYGCTFYPWVRARDTINGASVWLPPSVAALGTFSSSQRKTQVWFAPAGFNRGGLTEGAAGLPVVDVAHHLRRKDRDDLYASNVNPIAKFPAEGIVIFGQKTLQITPSALDRINVRRLMIFIKKRISQMASTILFDQNVKTTWARFTSLVDPFLADVKTNFGLTDYKVVLDDTTTTPDLIDRNILYAKIFLKPARAIEYIAIDFNITRTGAAFDD